MKKNNDRKTKRSQKLTKRAQGTGSKRQVSNRQRTRKHPAPRTAEQFLSQSPRSRDRWVAVVNVISQMRAHGLSLHRASREAGIDPRTVKRLGGPALRRLPNGRYVAKRSDRLPRVMVIPTLEGQREIAVRDFRQASLLGEYGAAVQRYIQTGDASALAKFRGKSITDADGNQFPLITDLSELDRLGAAGVFSFESLYAKTT